MKWLGGVAFVLIFTHLTPLEKPASHFTWAFQFEWQSKKPGNIIAFRLNPRYKKTGFVCTQGHCYKGEHQWTLIPTDLESSGNAGFLFQTPRGWSLRSFNMDKSLFDRSAKHLVHLRLPASVIKKIKKGDDDIFVAHERNSELYKINSNLPWSVTWRRPTQSAITSEFGSERIPPNGEPYSHTGVDLRAPIGTPVVACSDGIVLDTSYDPIYGNVITLDHGHGLLSRYMHLSKIQVRVGEFIKGGNEIGLSGTTGRSEAPHLHWEIRAHGQPVDPIETIKLMKTLALLSP